MNRNGVYWLLALGLIAGACGLSAWFGPALPAQVPTHWNIQGQVDGHGSKRLALLMIPATMLGMLILFRLLPALSPRPFEVDSFRSTYLYVMVVLLAMFAYLHAVILWTTARQVAEPDRLHDPGRALFAGIFLFLALTGNVLGKVRRNFYIGIRVPWTLASERVWNDTHRLGAWTTVAGSLLGLLVIGLGGPLPLAFVVLLAGVLTPIVYSYRHYKRLERQGALGDRMV